jgi:hypothetical protein
MKPFHIFMRRPGTCFSAKNENGTDTKLSRLTICKQGKLRYNESSMVTKGAVPHGYIYRRIGLRGVPFLYLDGWIQRGQNLESVNTAIPKKKAGCLSWATCFSLMVT